MVYKGEVSVDTLCCPNGDGLYNPCCTTPTPTHRPTTAAEAPVSIFVITAVAFGAADLVMLLGVMFLKFWKKDKFAAEHVTGARLLVMAWAGVDFCTDLLGLGELSAGAGGWRPLGLLMMAVSLGCNLLVIAVVVGWGGRSKQLDKREMDRMSAVVAFVLLLSVTNLDGLALLPWRSRQFNGFPAQRVILATVLGVLLENVPQFLLQFLNGRDEGGVGLSTVALATMTCSVLSIVFQVFRKVVISFFVDGAGGARRWSSSAAPPQVAPAPRPAAPAPEAKGGNTPDSSGTRVETQPMQTQEEEVVQPAVAAKSGAARKAMAVALN
jgi:hypothetical protein